MKESIFITLQKCTVFEGFTPEEIREALSMVSYRMVELAARETYVLAGMPCRYADIIVEGEMIARMSGLSGKQAQIERLGESMLIAPAYIFAHNNEMPVSVETSKKTTLLRMRPSELKLLIDTDERIRWNFIQHLSRIDIFLSQKMRMLSLFLRQGEGGAIPHQDGYRTAEQNHPTGCQPPGNGGYLRYPEVLAPPLPVRIRGEGRHQD